MRSAIASRHQLRVLSRRCLGIESASPSEVVRPRWTTARGYVLPAYAERADVGVDYSHSEVNDHRDAGLGAQEMGSTHRAASSPLAPPAATTPARVPKPPHKSTARKLSPKLQRLQSRLLLAQALREQAVSPAVPLSQLEGSLADVLPASRVAEDGEAADAPPQPTSDSAAQDPTLENLLRYRPSEKRKPMFYSKAYPKRYQAVSQRLGVAFVRTQLLKLCNEMLEANALEREMRATSFDAGSAGDEADAHGRRDTRGDDLSGLVKPRLRISHKASKDKILQCIMDAWGWPHPDALERDRKRRELENVVLEESIELSNAEAFLISRDEKLWKELASAPSLELSVQRAPSVAIKASGRAASLETWREAIKTRRAQCVSEDMSLHDLGGVRPELLQVVSEASGAFLEAVSDVQIRISYFALSARDKAMRLLAEAHYHLAEQPAQTLSAAVTVPASSSIIAAPTQMALYPFMPVTQRVDSAKLNTSTWWMTGRNVFRLRRAGGWTKKLSWDGAESLDDGKLDLLRGAVSASPVNLSELVASFSPIAEDAKATVHWEIAHGNVILSSAPFLSPKKAVHLCAPLAGPIKMSAVKQSLEQGTLTGSFVAGATRLPAAGELVLDSQDILPYRELVYRARSPIAQGNQELLYIFISRSRPRATDGQAEEAAGSLRALVVRRQRVHLLLPDGDRDVQITRDIVKRLGVKGVPVSVRDAMTVRVEEDPMETRSDGDAPPEIQLEGADTRAILISDRMISEVATAPGSQTRDRWRRVRGTAASLAAESELQHTIDLEGKVQPDELARLCLSKQ